MSIRDQFDTNISDSQATEVKPLKYSEFDIQAYADYEQPHLETCENFWRCKSRVLV